MIEITIKDVVEGLHSLVDLKGEEYRYPHAGGVCLYVEGGQPSCIVGHFLHNAGVPLERLVRADGGVSDSLGVPAEDLLVDLRSEGVINYTDSNVARMLQIAQGTQDSGYTWSHSVGQAVRSYR